MYRKSECFNKMNRTIGIRAIVNRGLQEPEMGRLGAYVEVHPPLNPPARF